MAKIRRLMLKYDDDGDGMISFDEFKAKATDVISSPNPDPDPDH